MQPTTHLSEKQVAWIPSVARIVSFPTGYIRPQRQPQYQLGSCSTSVSTHLISSGSSRRSFR